MFGLTQFSAVWVLNRVSADNLRPVSRNFPARSEGISQSSLIFWNCADLMDHKPNMKTIPRNRA